MDRVAVYTAIFGTHDALKSQPDLEGVDLVCFTDDPSLRSDRWRVEVRPPRYGHPRMSAKWFKLNPHVELEAYRYTVWIDASLQLTTETFAKEVLSFLDGKGLALFRHPDRDNIVDEAAVSATMLKYQGERVHEQVEHYRRKGFRSQNGLFAGGVLVRDNASRAIRRLNRTWMREILRWSSQDQLSLPYVLWKLDIAPGIIPYNLWDNPLFTWHAHATEL